MLVHREYRISVRIFAMKAVCRQPPRHRVPHLQLRAKIRVSIDSFIECDWHCILCSSETRLNIFAIAAELPVCDAVFPRLLRAATCRIKPNDYVRGQPMIAATPYIMGAP